MARLVRANIDARMSEVQFLDIVSELIRFAAEARPPAPPVWTKNSATRLAVGRPILGNMSATRHQLSRSVLRSQSTITVPKQGVARHGTIQGIGGLGIFELCFLPFMLHVPFHCTVIRRQAFCGLVCRTPGFLGWGTVPYHSAQLLNRAARNVMLSSFSSNAIIWVIMSRILALSPCSSRCTSPVLLRSFSFFSFDCFCGSVFCPTCHAVQ